MPGEVIDKPNPEALPSHLPDTANELGVALQPTPLEQTTCNALVKFRRAADYIAAGTAHPPTATIFPNYL